MKLLKTLFPSREFKTRDGQLLEKRVCGDDPSRGEVWTVSGETVEQLVAQKLGFDPFVNFVKVESGRVSFSCGKPQEIASLFRKCEAIGLPMSKSLKNARV